MIKIFFILFYIGIFGTYSAFGYEGESKNIHNTASYISKVAESIAKEFKKSKKTIVITPIVSLNDFKTSLPVTKRVDEELIYAMSKEGFNIIDTSSLKMLGIKNTTSDYILVSTFIRYKYEMIINSRIVDRKSGLVISVAEAKLPRKIVKDVDRLYKKHSWFSK